jgi:hypothetical protein
MAKKTGHTVTLVGFTLPIKTATDVRAISAQSRRKMADIGRQFFDEYWEKFLARHPDLKQMAENGSPKGVSFKRRRNAPSKAKAEAEMPPVESVVTNSEPESAAEAEAAPERSEGEMAATA